MYAIRSYYERFGAMHAGEDAIDDALFREPRLGEFLLHCGESSPARRFRETVPKAVRPADL